jgi:multiple sugar transport system substrate-binding protein
MRWRTPTLAAVATASIMGGVLSGVAGAASPSHTPVTIVWAASPITTAPAPDVRTYLIKEFEKAYPWIHVKLQSQPTDEDTNREELITQINSGSSSPDVYDGDVIWPAQFAKAGLAMDLSKVFPTSFFSRFASGLVAGATYNGQVYGAPFFMDAGFLYYRKDLLTEAHLPVPKTWAQLESDSKILVAKHLVRYGFVWEGDTYEGLTCDLMEYLTDAGGSILNGNKVTFDSPAAVKAVTFMRSLITSGVSPSAVTTFQEPQAMNVFADGQAAFLRNWDYAWSVSQSSPKIEGKVGVAPLPTFSASSYPGYSNIGGWNMYINPHSTHIAADKIFIEWMTGETGQEDLATFASEIPTNAAVQRLPAVRKLNPVLDIVSKVKLVARPSYTPDYTKVSTAIYTNVNLALTGQLSPKAAVTKAAQEIATAISGSGL